MFCRYFSKILYNSRTNWIKEDWPEAIDPPQSARTEGKDDYSSVPRHSAQNLTCRDAWIHCYLVQWPGLMLRDVFPLGPKNRRSIKDSRLNGSRTHDAYLNT